MVTYSQPGITYSGAPASTLDPGEFGDTLGDWQWRYRNGTRGLLFGADTLYDVSDIDGLDGWQARVGDLQLPRGHGAVPGKHYLPSRDPVLTLDVLQQTQEELEDRRDDLFDALQVSEDTVGTLEWKRPGTVQQFLRVRPVAVDWRTSDRTLALHVQPRVGFTAADPRVYAVAEQTELFPIYDATTGLDYPVANFAKNFSLGATGEKVVSNGGNADAWPLLRFYGPSSGTCTGVQLANLTTGVTVDVQTNITSGQVLVVDLSLVVTRIASDGNDDGLEVHIAGSTRYGSWQQTRTPLALQPGSNVLRFTGDGTTTDMQCRVDWRDTWL